MKKPELTRRAMWGALPAAFVGVPVAIFAAGAKAAPVSVDAQALDLAIKFTNGLNEASERPLGVQQYIDTVRVNTEYLREFLGEKS